MSTFTFPTARASGGVRLRYEDFTPSALARMATAQTALYRALLAEVELRRTLSQGLCASSSPDATFRSRLETMAKGDTAPASRAKHALDGWLAAINAIERVSPPAPPAPDPAARRYESFPPLARARMSSAQPALYAALRDEHRARSALVELGVCGMETPDTTIRSRGASKAADPLILGVAMSAWESTRRALDHALAAPPPPPPRAA